jgi:hypothetical protein
VAEGQDGVKMKSSTAMLALFTVAFARSAFPQEKVDAIGEAAAIGFYSLEKREFDHYSRLQEMSVEELLLYRKVLKSLDERGRISANQMILIDRLSKGTYNLAIVNKVIWGSNTKAKRQFQDEVELVEKLANEPDFENKMRILGLYEFLRLQKRLEATKAAKDSRSEALNELQQLMFKKET